MNDNSPNNEQLPPNPEVYPGAIVQNGFLFNSGIRGPEAHDPALLHQGPKELPCPFDLGPEPFLPPKNRPEVPLPALYQEPGAPHHLLGGQGLPQSPFYQGPGIHQQLSHPEPGALQPVMQQGLEVPQPAIYQGPLAPHYPLLGGHGLPQPPFYQGPRIHQQLSHRKPGALQPVMQQGLEVPQPAIYQGPLAPHYPLLGRPGLPQPPLYQGPEVNQFDREPVALQPPIQQRFGALYYQSIPKYNIYSNYGAFAPQPSSWISGSSPQRQLTPPDAAFWHQSLHNDENWGDLHPQSSNGRPTGAPVCQPPLQAQFAPPKVNQLRELQLPEKLHAPNINSYGNGVSSVFDTPEFNGNTSSTSGYNQTQPITQAAVDTPKGNRNTGRFKPYGKTENSKERTRIIRSTRGEPIELAVPARVETVALRAVSSAIKPEEMKRRQRPPENFGINEFAKLFKKGQDTNKVREYLSTFNIEESNGDPPSTTSFSFLTEQESVKLGMELGKMMNFFPTEGSEMKKTGHSIAQRIITKHGQQQLEKVKTSTKSIRILLEAYIKLFAPGFVESLPSFYFNIMTHGFGYHGVLGVVQLMFAMTFTVETSEGAAVETRPASGLFLDNKVFQTISSRLDKQKCDVTTGEVRRRCEGPEGMPITYLRAILRGSKSGGYSEKLRELLDAEGIKTVKGKKRNLPDTLFSSLAEEDAKTLAKDAAELLQSVRTDESFERSVGGISVNELFGARCFLSILSELASEAMRWEASCEELINFEMNSHSFGNMFLTGVCRHILKLIQYR